MKPLLAFLIGLAVRHLAPKVADSASEMVSRSKLEFDFFHTEPGKFSRWLLNNDNAPSS